MIYKITYKIKIKLSNIRAEIRLYLKSSVVLQVIQLFIKFIKFALRIYQ